MYEISSEIRQKIQDAIKEAESQTSAELVAVVTQKSGDYLYISVLIASVLALLFPFGILFFFPDMDVFMVYGIQLLAFMFLLLLLTMPPVLRFILPKSLFIKAAKLKAYETFDLLGLYKTSNHQAVMIFVSLYEHAIEIITDSGINAKIDDTLWQKTIHDFINAIHHDGFEQGYLNAIREISTLLREHFPIQKDDKNELPNTLIEV